MAHILAVGNAALDVINEVESYPSEDQELRAKGQRIVRGGNAANTLAVLVQLGHRADFIGTLAREPNGERIAADLRARGIGIEHALWAEGRAPTSYITLSRATGSRTIIHLRDLPELPSGQLDAVQLSGYDWIHFEGRNVEALLQMMTQARRQRVDQPISLEVEKERDGIDRLLPLADLILFSRPFAQGRGFSDSPTFLTSIRDSGVEAILISTWGEAGAWAMGRSGEIWHAPAFSPARVVDTVGAGDTFAAGVISGLCDGLNLEGTLEAASRLAGRKCGQFGLDGLVSVPGESATA